MKTILVTGGTGTLGKEIVKQLQGKGFQVEILSSKESPELVPGARIVKGDVTVKESLQEAVRNADVIIHCASNPRRPREVDIEGIKNLIAVASEGKFPHFIYVSITGVDSSTFPYYQAKYEVENLVKASNMPWSIVRATQFHDLVFYRIIKPFDTDNGLPIKIPKGLKFQSIDIKDAAEFIIETSIGKPTKSVTTIGGPEILTIEEMTETYLIIMGRKNAIEPNLMESEFYNVFRSGVNLCPDYKLGRITWEEYVWKLSECRY